ncbi:hypothetical protein [Streptomyces mirabilis]|uniref:hypothetical protein n=1 Tax=Streptomyces mirabilis TaxID=68239 RepID=UPI0033B82123
MNKGNPDLLLYFGGHLEMEADKVRTVGAKDAIKRLRTLKLLPPGVQLDKLIELRNGTAHTTVGDQAKALLPTLAETVALLLKEVGLSVEGFWGRWTSMVSMAVDKQRNEIERNVQIRIRQARHRFEDRFKGLPDNVKERALPKPENVDRGITISNTDGMMTLVATTRCPACGADAQVWLLPANEEPVSPALLPASLVCRLCGLQLRGPKEVKAAGVNDGTFVLPPTVKLYWGAERVDVDLDDTHSD